MLLSTLVLAAIAAARWHSAHGHAQQAAAAHQAAEHLRAAYRQAAATPLRALHVQGQALPDTDRRRYEATIRIAVPNTTEHQDVRRRDALAATLAQAEQAGHDPNALLERAIAMRELDTADNVNDVLVWRIRRLADLPAHTRSSPTRTKSTTVRATAMPDRAPVHRVPTAQPGPAAPTPGNSAPRR
jgi:hypothetical protein